MEERPGLPSFPLIESPHRKLGDRQLVDILHLSQAESTKQGGESYIGKEKNKPCMKTPRLVAGIHWRSSSSWLVVYGIELLAENRKCLHLTKAPRAHLILLLQLPRACAQPGAGHRHMHHQDRPFTEERREREKLKRRMERRGGREKGKGGRWRGVLTFV